MKRQPLSRRPRAPLALILVFALLGAPLATLAQDAAEDERVLQTSELEVRVEDEQGRALSGARVVAQNMSDESALFTGTTDGEGEVAFTSIPYGHYRVAISYEGRVYAGNRTLLLPPERDLEATFTLGPFLPEDEPLGLQPGQEVELLEGRAAEGVARLQERTGPRGWAWLRTGTGVTVVVGGGALLVAGLIALSEDDDEEEPDVSPVQ